MCGGAAVVRVAFVRSATRLLRVRAAVGGYVSACMRTWRGTVALLCWAHLLHVRLLLAGCCWTHNMHTRVLLAAADGLMICIQG
jgi:hypothetical protein